MTTTTKKSTKTPARARTAKPAVKAPAKPAAAVMPKVEKVSQPATAPAPAPSVVEAPQSVILGPVLRKKELIANVVERSGRKKKDVKPVVEALLEELGQALAENRELNLHPLGKLKVRREKKMPNGRMMVAKIRQPKAAGDAG